MDLLPHQYLALYSVLCGRLRGEYHPLIFGGSRRQAFGNDHSYSDAGYSLAK